MGQRVIIFTQLQNKGLFYSFYCHCSGLVVSYDRYAVSSQRDPKVSKETRGNHNVSSVGAMHESQEGGSADLFDHLVK